MRPVNAVRTALALALVCVAPIAAAPASAATPLDPSYGTGGMTTQIWKTLSIPVVEAMLVQPDGKVLVAGSAIPDPLHGHGYGDLVVGRLLADGTPDPGFGTNGRIFVELMPPCSSCYSVHVAGMALQGDGSIVLAAARHDSIGKGQPALTRLTKNGALDTTFGNGGASDPLLGGSYTIPDGVAADTGLTPDIFTGVIGLGIDPTGIVLVGFRFGTVLVERFNSDGAFQTSYASGGRLETTLPGTMSTSPTAAVGEGDGSVLIAGTSSVVWYTDNCICGDGSKLAIAHVTAGGAFDGGPGTPNFHIKVFPDDTNNPHDPMVVPWINDAFTAPVIVPRPAGGWFAPFSTFWSGPGNGNQLRNPGNGVGVGIVAPGGATTTPGFVERDRWESVLDAKTDTSGRLYVLVKEATFPFTTPAPPRYVLLRFTAQGTPDPTLAGGAGEIVLDKPASPTRLAVQSDGAVLVGGTRSIAPPDAQVARIPVAELGAAPGTPAGGTPAAPPAAKPATSPPSASVGAVAARLRASALKRLRLPFTCTGACTVKVAARVRFGGPRPAASKVATVALTGGSATLPAAGAGTVLVTASPKQLKRIGTALKARKKVWLVLTFTGGAALNRPVTRVTQVAR